MWGCRVRKKGKERASPGLRPPSSNAAAPPSQALLSAPRTESDGFGAAAMFGTSYHEALLPDEGATRTSRMERRWRTAAAIGVIASAVLSLALVDLSHRLSAAKSQLQAHTEAAVLKTPWAQPVPRPNPVRTGILVDVDGTPENPIFDEKCTMSGLDIFTTGEMLGCCMGLVLVSSPCRGDEICQFCVGSAPPDACTPAGTDIYDNSLHRGLKCCPGLVLVDTPCRGDGTCKLCQPKGMGQAGCTPPGKEVFETGSKLPCCKGLTESTGPWASIVVGADLSVPRLAPGLLGLTPRRTPGYTARSGRAGRQESWISHWALDRSTVQPARRAVRGPQGEGQGRNGRRAVRPWGPLTSPMPHLMPYPMPYRCRRSQHPGAAATTCASTASP